MAGTAALFLTRHADIVSNVTNWLIMGMAPAHRNAKVRERQLKEIAAGG